MTNSSSVHPHFVPLAKFLLDFAPDRLSPLIKHILSQERNTPGLCQFLLSKDPARYEEVVASHYRVLGEQGTKLTIAQELYRLDPKKYGLDVLGLTRALMANPNSCTFSLGIWMVESFGVEVLGDPTTSLESSMGSSWHKTRVLAAMVKVLGADAFPAVLAMLRKEDPESRLAALEHLIALNDGSHDATIREAFERGLQETRPEHLLAFLKLIPRWKIEPFQERFWSLLGHKSKPVRDAAAQALGKLGDAVVSRAARLLGDKKSDVRAAAVTLLAAVNSPDALEALEARLDLEANADIRDAMLVALDAARAASGREITHEEIKARIARAAPKLTASVADWLDESALPLCAIKRRRSSASRRCATCSFGSRAPGRSGPMWRPGRCSRRSTAGRRATSRSTS